MEWKNRAVWHPGQKISQEISHPAPTTPRITPPQQQSLGVCFCTRAASINMNLTAAAQMPRPPRTYEQTLDSQTQSRTLPTHGRLLSLLAIYTSSTTRRQTAGCRAPRPFLGGGRHSTQQFKRGVFQDNKWSWISSLRTNGRLKWRLEDKVGWKYKGKGDDEQEKNHEEIRKTRLWMNRLMKDECEYKMSASKRLPSEEEK